MYGVQTRRLNEQISRNLDRFPDDLSFKLNKQKVVNLMSQIATSKEGMNRLETTAMRKYDNIPDVRDGLTRKERVVLYCLNQTQLELKGRNVPTAMLYGRVLEYVDMSEQELQGILQRLSGFNANPAG